VASVSTKVWVGFSTTNKFMSRVIRFFTRGRCSHAWIRYWDDTLQQYMVMQAELHGYETIPWKRWRTKNKLVAAFEPVTLDLMSGVRFMASFLGADYDLRSALWVGLTRWLKKRWHRPASSPGSLMCSEAVCRILQTGEIKCVRDLNPEQVSPQELLDRLAQSTDFILVPNLD
jgi:hypothetical protein